MLHGDGALDALEYDLYCKWFAMIKRTATPLSAIVIVDTDPVTCHARIAERAR